MSRPDKPKVVDEWLEPVPLEDQIKELKAKLESIEESIYWKLTLPLRYLVARIPRGFRRRIGRNHPTPVETNSGQDTQSPASYQSDELSDLATKQPSAKIAVVLHLYHQELYPEFSKALRQMPEPFDLYVSIVSGPDHGILARIQRDYPGAVVRSFDNRGRDILPFLLFLETGVLGKYDLVCKIHSKKSAHHRIGKRWRRELLRGLLGNSTSIGNIIQAFRQDPNLGIVAPKIHIVKGERHYWMNNTDKIYELGAHIGITNITKESEFPAGSMFWARTSILEPIKSLNLTPDDFEPEPIGVDGSTAHAIERLFGLSCTAQGMRIGSSEDCFAHNP